MWRCFKALSVAAAVSWLTVGANAQAPASPLPQSTGTATQAPQEEGPVVTQTPPPPPGPRRPSVLPPGVDRLRLMQTVAAALGVECAFCLANLDRRGRPTPLTSSGKPRMEVAREMFLMVDAINMQVQTATDKTAADATRVQCVTCHRGVPIPKQLSEILTQTALKQEPDAVAAQYHELRAQFYGRQAYDFSEPALVAIGERLAAVRPNAGVALMQATLEHYPQSSVVYTVLGMAQSNASEYQGAIESLRKALALNPQNNIARGRLAQLEGQSRRRPQ
jgi:hypothetical protein